MADESHPFDDTLADWPIPSELLVELGRIASLWGVLEDMVNFSLAEVGGVYSDGPKQLILFQHLGMPQKLDMLAALAGYSDEKSYDAQELSEALLALRKAQTERNRFMHNPITSNSHTGAFEISHISARGKLRITTSQVSVGTLREVSELIHEATRRLSTAVFGEDGPQSQPGV